jgi:arylsulfatase A-like enzyme
MGYGDLALLNDESKVPTPYLDNLAMQGLLFTDAHSASTVCTPSRYSLLTGRMAFRTGKRGVFVGTGGPCLIEEERLTLPEIFKEKGYRTAMVGKWHVGLSFWDSLGRPLTGGGLDEVMRTDFSRTIPDGPVNRGFDTFFGTACCPTTDYLYAFIENDRIPVPPDRLLDKSTIPDHPYSRDCRRGFIAPGYDMEEIDIIFLKKSLEFLKQHSEESPDQPFFLYHATQAVHLPSLAGEDFMGKTDAGPHGDFLAELDYVVGELVKGLEEYGFADNTVVIFSSDNGPEVTTTIHMRKDHGHDPARPWRGMKRDQWEGGHRVPLIIKWPGVIESGRVSDQMISLTDIMATCASIIGYDLPIEAAEDSYDFLPVLKDIQGDKPVRNYMLEQTNRLELSIRYGDWKYLDHKGSGGNNYDRGVLAEYKIEDTDPDAPGQLYDLENDPGETVNLYSKYPDIVSKLKSQLDLYVESGNSNRQPSP